MNRLHNRITGLNCSRTLLDAVIDECFMRAFGRKADGFDLEFFRPKFRSGQLGASGLLTLLMNHPESAGKDHHAWPSHMTGSGWN